VLIRRILKRRFSISYFVRGKDEGAFLFRQPFSRVTIPFQLRNPLSFFCVPKSGHVVESRRSEEFAVAANRYCCDRPAMFQFPDYLAIRDVPLPKRSIFAA